MPLPTTTPPSADPPRGRGAPTRGPARPGARRPALAALVALCCLSAAPAAERTFGDGVFLSQARLATLRARIAGTQPTAAAWLRVQGAAQRALTMPPHAPATWYVPPFYDDQAGHRAAKQGLQDDANGAYALALAYAMTGDRRYSAQAVRLIDAWSTRVQRMSRADDSTLSFSYHFPPFIFAADLLRACPDFTAAAQARFRAFVRDKALPQNTMQSANNWGNWGLTLVLASASYLGDRALFDRGVARWKVFIEQQIAADGHLPHEVHRNGGSAGIWYTHFTLLPQTIAAEIARVNGVDLYDYRAPNGRSLRLAFDRVAGWTAAPATFPYWTGDPRQLHSLDYASYYEILDRHWPNPAAASMIRAKRPMSAVHGAPFLTFTHGDLLHDGAAVAPPAPGAQPVITAQPVDRTVRAGQPASFSVAASGSPAPTYQWQRNGTPIAGATAASYTVPAAAAGDHGAAFRCVVRNRAGSVISRTALLTVATTGWDASYHDGLGFTGARVQRIDAAIDFGWGTGGPAAAIGADTFSVRWRGFVTPAFSQIYTFAATADDGVRVWVDGRRIIDRWVDQGATVATGRMALTAGVPVLVVVEYYERAGAAQARLEWQSASQARQVIPASAVRPAAAVWLSDLPLTVEANGWGPLERDRSNGEAAAGDGRVLTIADRTFAKGLGVHASSAVRTALDGAYARFQATIGVDAEEGGGGSVVFRVYGDDALLFDSGLMTGGQRGMEIDVDVGGRSALRLVVTDGGDGAAFDHADWADARLVPAAPLPPANRG